MLDAFIVDIALMVYSEKQFARRESSDVDTRLAALLSHRAVTRTHGVAMLMTEDLVAELLTTFPWNATDDRALRDLRTFALQDLNRALMVRPIGDGRVSIDPDGVLALRVNRQSTVKAWHDLLAGALIGEAWQDKGLVMASWHGAADAASVESVSVRIENASRFAAYELQLVVSDAQWAARLVLVGWPTLAECVSLLMRSKNETASWDRGYGRGLTVVQSDSFTESAIVLCKSREEKLQLVEAVMKVVWGRHDAGLGWERFRKGFRFRVTGDRRIHCRVKGSTLFLDEFGPHGIGGVS